jgi:hypothetical protein
VHLPVTKLSDFAVGWIDGKIIDLEAGLPGASQVDSINEGR